MHRPLTFALKTLFDLDGEKVLGEGDVARKIMPSFIESAYNSDHIVSDIGQHWLKDTLRSRQMSAFF